MQADEVALAEKDEVAIVTKAAVSAEREAVAARLEAVEATLAALQAQMQSQPDASGRNRYSGSGAQSSNRGTSTTDGSSMSVGTSSSSVSGVSNDAQEVSESPAQSESSSSVSPVAVSSSVTSELVASGADAEHSGNDRSWPQQVMGVFQRAPWQVAGAPQGGVGSRRNAKDSGTGATANISRQ